MPMRSSRAVVSEASHLEREIELGGNPLAAGGVGMNPGGARLRNALMAESFVEFGPFLTLARRKGIAPVMCG